MLPHSFDVYDMPRRDIDFGHFYEYFRPMKDRYPDLDKWYSKFMQEYAESKRRVVELKVHTHPAGAVLIKDTPEEKKICAIRLMGGYRKFGYGELLMQKAIDSFQDRENIGISVSEEVREDMEPFLNKFGFRLVDEKIGLYRPGVREYFYKT